MRVHLHIPAYTLGKPMPKREVVFENFPLQPFVGMQIDVAIGDGSSEAPGQTALVQVASVRVGCEWFMTKEPRPNEDAYDVECFTNWVRVPGRRSRNG